LVLLGKIQLYSEDFKVFDGFAEVELVYALDECMQLLFTALRVDTLAELFCFGNGL
jgi:hypothetical protein